MKTLFIFLSFFIALSTQAQPPTWNPPNPDSLNMTILNQGAVNMVKVGNLTKTKLSLTKWAIDSALFRSLILPNNYVTSGSFANNTLTLNRNGLSAITATIDSTYFSTRAWRQKLADSLSALIAANSTAISNEVTNRTTAVGLKADKSTTLTINGTAFDLSANRSWTITGGSSDSTLFASKYGVDTAKANIRASIGSPSIWINNTTIKSTGAGDTLNIDTTTFIATKYYAGTLSTSNAVIDTAIAQWFRTLPGWVGDGTVSLRGNFTWSVAGASQTQLTTPTLTAGTPTSSTIPLSWSSITNATGYTVDKSTNNSTWTNIYTGAGTSTTASGLTSATLHYFRVNASATGYTTSNYGTTTGTTSGTAVDADATTFINAVQGTGATLSATQQAVIDTLVKHLKGTTFSNDTITFVNTWDKDSVIYFPIGGTAAAHKFNLKNPVDLNSAHRITWNGTWTHSASGADPNGSNAFGDSYFIPSTALSGNSTNWHMSYYSGENTSTSTSAVMMGALNSSSSEMTMGARVSGTTYVDGLQSTRNASANTSTLNNGAKGDFLATSTSSTALILYVDGVQFATTATANTGTLPTVEILIGAYNNNGSAAAGYDNKVMQGATIGLGFSATEAKSQAVAFKQANTTLAR